MTVLLALCAAAAYGVSDFLGGIASRRRTALTVLLYGYPVGALAMIAMVPLFPGTLNTRALLCGIAGGICGMVGVITLYWLMTAAPMNIISPVTAVLAAMVPVAYGVAVGERPSLPTWAGIVIGGVAVALISRTPEDHPHGPVAPHLLALALLAGTGFAGYFIFLDQAPDASGAWPVVISRWTSALLIIPVVFARKAAGVIRGRLLVVVLAAGLLDASANLFFLLATREGYLSVASVLTSLYPAVTVALAIGLLREHTGRLQWVGFGMAAASVALIAS